MLIKNQNKIKLMDFENRINLEDTVIICSNTIFINNIKYFNKLRKKISHLLITKSKLPDYNYLLKKYQPLKNQKFKNLLVIGGGKTIDSGKIIMNYFYNKKKNINLYILPTLLGSGAEITSSAVSFENKIILHLKYFFIV